MTTDQLAMFEEVDPGRPAGNIASIPDKAIEHQQEDMDMAVELLDWLATWEEEQWRAALRQLHHPVVIEVSEDAKLHIRVQRLHHLGEALFWAIGDEINGRLGVLGKMQAYRAAAGAMGSSPRWAMEMSRVAAAFPKERRLMGVPWNLYRACAAQSDPIAALEQALGSNLKADQVRHRERKK